MWGYSRNSGYLTHVNRYQGVCAGKSSIAEYLVKHQGYTRLYLRPPQHEDQKGLDPITSDGLVSNDGPYLFNDAPTLLEFVTQRWQQRWVVTDIWNEKILQNFTKRPFFLLVSIDAPLGVRWKRLKIRQVWSTSAFLTS